MLPIRSSAEGVGFGASRHDASDDSEAASGSSDRHGSVTGHGHAGFSDSGRIFRVNPIWLNRRPTDFGSSDHALPSAGPLESGRRSCRSQTVGSEAGLALARQESDQCSTQEYWGEGCEFRGGNGMGTNETLQRGAFDPAHSGRPNCEALAQEASAAWQDVMAGSSAVSCDPCRDPDMISLDRRLGTTQSVSGRCSQPTVAAGSAEISASQPFVGGASSYAGLSPSDALLSSGKLLDELKKRVEQTSALVEQLRVKGVERRAKLERLDKTHERRRQESESVKGQRAAAEVQRQEVASEEMESRPIDPCPHYQRRCKVKFECCEKLYGCHRCHNADEDRQCGNDQVKALQATQIECNLCHVRQDITEDSQYCSNCNLELAQYFCSKCKHFASAYKYPFHCDKCGICRTYKDEVFHCDVCNVCLDKKLEGKHTCRANSGHDSCCICFEDVFSGCRILSCSHKVHKECVVAMVQHGIRSCPSCRHPLFGNHASQTD